MTTIVREPSEDLVDERCAVCNRHHSVWCSICHNYDKFWGMQLPVSQYLPKMKTRNMKITKLTFNWYPIIHPDESGEQFQERSVGYNCKEIIAHIPQGEGDRLWYDVVYDDNTIERVFNPNVVSMIPEPNE